MKGFYEAQNAFIHKIRSAIPVNISLVDELAELLQVSNDSAYRRIRCETALTIDEILIICRHFKLSFDSVTNVQTGCVNFNYNPIRATVNMVNYLKEIRDEMLMISKVPDAYIIYTAVDVPVFHYFKFPEYFYFKMFYWLRSVASDPELRQKKFSTSLIDPEIRTLCSEIADLYSMVSSTEVWSDSILDSVLKQISYYWESGVFETREDALRLIEAIRKTLAMVQRESEINMKLLISGETNNFSKNFHLYQSDIEVVGNNYIMYSIGGKKVLYQSFHTFNKMYTTSQEFCELTEEWMDNIIKQANLISGVGEKYRILYFNNMYTRLDELETQIRR